MIQRLKIPNPTFISVFHGGFTIPSIRNVIAELRNRHLDIG
jgi:hypothetical protein